MNCPRQKTLETTRGACRASGVACLLSVALFAAPLAARAFDSGAWLDKRAALDGEADRLRRAYAACAAHIVSPAENVTLPVESHPDGSVKALPALPEAWASGSVRGLRTRGGQTVDMKWKDGKVVSLKKR